MTDSRTTEERFDFGENWKAFLATIDEDRIAQAVASLREMLGIESMKGLRFLDLGSGSGLFSLAAHRLGAEVVSIDYDTASVSCTDRLRTRFSNDASRWQVRQGSVLDATLMQSLGEFDVVYSWGVLHHTGDMRRAIENSVQRCAPGTLLMIAIYNDQGGASRRWLWIKKFYNRLPVRMRPVWVVVIAGLYELKFAAARMARFQNPLPFADWREKKADRGMSVWHDWVDWIGGLPFEVSKPEAIIVPLRKKGFIIENLKTVGNGWGCNEYVFRRERPTRCS